MFKKITLIGALAFAPLMAVAAEQPEAQFHTITVQGGQGNAVTLRIPIREEAPYALTGFSAVKAPRMVLMQFGQGGLIRVPMRD